MGRVDDGGHLWVSGVSGDGASVANTRLDYEAASGVTARGQRADAARQRVQCKRGRGAVRLR